MRKLLDVRYLPYFQLLKYCSKRPPKESIKVISTKINLDRRVLLKIIKEIQIDSIENNWVNVLILELKEGELTVTRGPLFSLDLFYSHYMSKSFCVKLMLYLFQHQSATIYELIDNLYISKSTFYRKIIPLREILTEFNLDLAFTNKQNILIGEEKQIRYFFFTFFWEIFNSVPPDVSSLNSEDDRQLHSFSVTFNLPIPLAKIISIHLIIALTRIKQGFYLQEFPSYFLLPVYITQADFNTQFEHYFDSRKLSPEKLEIELNFLFFLLVTSTLYPPSAEKDLKLQKIDWFAPSLIFCQKWVNYYTNFFNCTLSNEDYFYLLINLHLTKLKKQVLTGNSFSFDINTTEELLSDHPYILTQINNFFDFLNQKEPEFHLTPFQRVTYARLIRRIVSKSNPPLQILICSKIGKEETDWMNQFIQKISPIPLNIHTLWKPDLDLIISDYPLQQSLVPDDLTHYFLYSSFSGLEEWSLLLKRLEELYYIKTMDSKQKHQEDSSL